jgi:serine/threonine protein kinase
VLKAWTANCLKNYDLSLDRNNLEPNLIAITQSISPNLLSIIPQLKQQAMVFDKVECDDGQPLRIGDVVRDTSANRLLSVVDVLGQGAYAVVYLVREVKTNKFYALKCLCKRGLTWEQLSLQREEAKLHKLLGHHRNIVYLDRYFENRDWLYLVLEYCPGRDLFEWISGNHDEFTADGRRRSESKRRRLIKDVFAQALEAVVYCHKRGVYHRDLKPENFIVCDNGTVKLTDFGLATQEERSFDFDCGSQPYMSYECRIELDESYSPRTADVWSMGVLLLTMLYKRTPWAAASPEECKPFSRFLQDPIRYLTHEFECEAQLSVFLARRVFCLKGRISSSEFLRLWQEEIIFPIVKNSNVSSKGVRRRRPDAKVLLKLLNETQSEKPITHKSQNSWSDDEMDFSEPLFFGDEESTEVEECDGDGDSFDESVGSLPYVPVHSLPIPALPRPSTCAASAATAVGSMFFPDSLKAMKQRMESDNELVFAMDALEV